MDEREGSEKWAPPCSKVSHVYIYHTHTPGAVFQARLLDDQGGATTELCVFGKLSGEMSPTPTFSAAILFKLCGGIEHRKSTGGGVRYTRYKGGFAAVG